MIFAGLSDLPADLWSTIGTTLRLAACTTLVLLIIAIPLAHWLVHSRLRIRPIIEVLVSLPIVLPPTVIGFYLLVFMSPHEALGRLWTNIVGSPLPFSFTGLVVGSVLYSLPFAVQPIQTAFRSVEPTLIEGAIALGAPARKVFRHIIVPTSWHGIATGATLSFAHTVGEFGVVLMLGGNIPGRTRVASIALKDLVDEQNYAAANTLALLLILISLALLSLIAASRRQYGAPLPKV